MTDPTTRPNPQATTTGGASRREFLRTSSLLGAALAAGAGGSGAHAAGSDTIKIGLVGCGGRGTGAATNAMAAGKDVRLVALGDMFPEPLSAAREALQREGGDRFDVPEGRCFTGFDAYKQVIASGVDVVLLATPPGFRPVHFQAAVDAGKHCFVEKPVAVDGPGVRAVLAASEQAKAKNLSVVSGLCWRYHNAMRETVKRIHDGAIGRVEALQCTYNVGNAKPPLPHDPRWSDMEWQIRNWLYFTWLSGDHYVEQHVHNLDVAVWALGAHPLSCVGMGGREVNTGPEFGESFDHFAVDYEFPEGVHIQSMARQIAGCASDVSENLVGTKGRAKLTGGRNGYQFEGPGVAKMRSRDEVNPYVQEHIDLLESITAGKPINELRQVAESTLTAIMGRMSAFTGKQVTWEQALNSKLNTFPGTPAWGSRPAPMIPVPGQTELI